MTRFSIKIILPLLVCLLTTAVTVKGQQRTRISGSFNGASFSELIKSIEDQTEYRFYFDPATTDSIKVTVTADNEEITHILEKILSTTDLHFAIYKTGIYITKEREIMTSLADDYFEPSKTKSATPAFDYSELERKEKQQKQAEEKLYSIGPRSENLVGNATLSGVITDAASGEPVIGASVFLEKPLIGAVTNQFGYYSLTLPKGRHEIQIKSVGMKSTRRQVMVYNNGKLNIEIDEDVTPLKEVVVESDRDVNVTGMQMGMDKLDIKTMKQIPLALGETDIMKVVLTLPGVQTVGEGTVGLNVRGGATNQNLILYNDAVVYNPSHLFGFFSTFNPDVLKNVELYKSGISADYGGRLSSVLDVHTREGNLKKIEGSGGISPITGRFTIEGPLWKEKTSFLFGARSTYSNWILRQLKDKEIKNSAGSFYDFNGSINHKIDDDNQLYLSGYMSKDKFKLNNDTTYEYSDKNASLKWKHIFNSKLYGVATASTSQYTYSLYTKSIPTEGYKLDFSIRQWTGKADFSYFPNAKHAVTGGISVTNYNLTPGNYDRYGIESKVVAQVMQRERGLENAIYVGDNYELTPKIALYGGVRFSLFQNRGPRDVFTYAEGVPLQESTIQDTISYRSKSIKTYAGAEPRFSLRYVLSKEASVKLSYNRMRQYIQMLSNTTAISPTDIWKLSDTHIKPQIGDQFSAGIYKNFKNGLIETSVEAYYKTTENAIDFKDGAELLLNTHLETEVIQGKGKAYGVEFLIKKQKGKLNGWISYTYSRTLLQMRSEHATETINEGKWYAASYDKPHAANFVGNYKFSRRFNFSLNFTYSTGRPITVPIAKYVIDGIPRLYYSDRNAHRIPDYIRTDIAINIEGNHRIKKLAHSSWTFAVYNLFGRANAYSVYFQSESSKINGYKMSIFARPIPTITYNFKF
ncbi:carboxypeptidase-like regulatory domain-containing protein [Pseudochryseolinea flava]|uniref:TonB-dependent receptor n=1 Tax=Pseudochryseolinea flava TaxID=2059302 RepID=A0A364XZF6_9BACT|nr:carboxypeptidase-like regulatory domain-containing protein [Pseudochryseolinea flava]RAV99873.1 TonB-dependent receptor [Pseudochryseolinea flava]